jgi:hypothetical protein
MKLNERRLGFRNALFDAAKGMASRDAHMVLWKAHTDDNGIREQQHSKAALLNYFDSTSAPRRTSHSRLAGTRQEGR